MSDKTENSKEKRSKVRIPLIYGIEFDDPKIKAEYGNNIFTSKIKINDISADGIQLTLPNFLPSGTSVKLSIELPRPRTKTKSSNDECIVKAIVRWVKKSTKKKGFLTGLMFSEFENDSKSIINTYLENNIDPDQITL